MGGLSKNRCGGTRGGFRASTPIPDSERRSQHNIKPGSRRRRYGRRKTKYIESPE